MGREMSSQDSASKVARVLDGELGELAAEAGESIMPPLAARSWNLPSEDIDALFEYGLPAPKPSEYMSLEGAFQDSLDPAYSDGDSAYYLLGRLGAVLLGARSGDGLVFAIPEDREVIPALRDEYPEGIQDSLAASSVRALVELGWRWSMASVILVEEQKRAEAARRAAWEAARTTGESYVPENTGTEYTALCARVKEAFAGIDPVSVDTDDRLWTELIEGY